jgi:hypothetical protein
MKSLKISFKNKNFYFLVIYFSLLIGSYKGLASLFEVLIVPFKFYEQASGFGGALLIFSGIMGNQKIKFKFT